MSGAGFILSQIGAVLVFLVLLAGLVKGVVGLRYQRVQYWQLERFSLSLWEREGAGHADTQVLADDSEDEEKKSAWKKALGIFSRKGPVLLGPVSHRRDTLFLLNGVLFFLVPFSFLLAVLRYPLGRCCDACIRKWPPPDDNVPRGPHVVTTTSTSMATSRSQSSISTSTAESAELVDASQPIPPASPPSPPQPPLQQEPPQLQSAKRVSIVQMDRMARSQSRIRLAREASPSKINVQDATESLQPKVTVNNVAEGPPPKIVVQNATEAPSPKITVKNATESPRSKITAKNPHQYPSFQSHNYNLDISRQFVSHHQLLPATEEVIEQTRSQNTSLYSNDEILHSSSRITARTTTKTAPMKDSSATTHANNSTSTPSGSYSSGDRRTRTKTEPSKNCSNTTHEVSTCIPSNSYVPGDYTPHAQISTSTPSSSYVSAEYTPHAQVSTSTPSSSYVSGDYTPHAQMSTSIPSSSYSSRGRKTFRSREEISTSQRSLPSTCNSSPYLSQTNAETITTPVYVQDTSTSMSSKRNSSRAKKIYHPDKDSSRTVPTTAPMKSISATTHANASTSITSNINPPGYKINDRRPKDSPKIIPTTIPKKNISATPNANASISISSSSKREIYRHEKDSSGAVPTAIPKKHPHTNASTSISSDINSSSNRNISRPGEETFSNRGTSPVSGESWLRVSQNNAQSGTTSVQPKRNSGSVNSNVSIHTMLTQVSPTFSRDPSLNSSQVTRHLEPMTAPLPMKNNSSSCGHVHVSIHTMTSSSGERDVFHQENGKPEIRESRQFSDNPSLHPTQIDPHAKTKVKLTKSSCLGPSFRVLSLPPPGKYEAIGPGVQASASGLQDKKKLTLSGSNRSTCLPVCPEDSQSDGTEEEQPARPSSPRQHHPPSDKQDSQAAPRAAQPRRRSRFLAIFSRSDEERRPKALSSKKKRRRRTRSNCAVCRLYAADDRV